MTAQGRIRIGTSGWHYGHWIGPFYTEGTRPEGFLAHYASVFDTAEINSTFYSLPKPQTLDLWRKRTPEGFVFACKASRYVTHMKKLSDPQSSCRRFFEAITGLDGKLGPILFQLPPRWQVNVERLEGFLGALPGGHRYAFEFRDESWFSAAVYDRLARHGAAFCVYDLNGRQAPPEVTADFVYLRLHGPGDPYRGSYGEAVLAAWARRILSWRKAGLDVYGYFDNDEKGYAAQNARSLRDLVA